MKKLFIISIGLILSFFGGIYAQTIHILSLNDMHAAVENMPKLGAVVDSLRAIDPELIVLSGGDNRTGNPINDTYPETSLPMTEMMNAVGFNASAIGNHEFDSKIPGFRNLINKSNFQYLCANVAFNDTMRVHVYPYKFMEAHGVKLGLLGAVQINDLGIPDSHPDNLVGVRFRKPDEVIPEYAWMRDQCDVFILLSHDGFGADTLTAHKYPFFDAIVGGHTHTKVDGTQLFNGVMVTQAGNKVRYATLSTFEVADGKVVKKDAKLIDVANFPKEKEEVTELLAKYSTNPYLEEVLTQVESPFETAEELGNMEMDALIAELGADVAIQNGGGVRYSTFPAGPMKVADVLKLDPFANPAVVYEMTGKELEDFIMNDFDLDEKQIPIVGGIRYEMKVNEATLHPTGIKIEMLNGKKFNRKATYKVVTNSYASSISTSEKRDKGTNLEVPCSDYVMSWLKKQATLNYTGSKRAKVVFE